MKYIAHRGNMTGPSVMENHPDHIREALDAGFDVEVDVWLIDGDLCFGHDEPQYPAHITVLNNRYWLHCKNLEALKFFGGIEINEANVFWHENDDFTLTNKKYIWTNIDKELTSRSVMVMPELAHDNWLLYTTKAKCYGICSDFVQYIKEERA
tara:strand:+ start:1917 stop:2375 length:459 start_codon:yes stop_codon:yes gene_type:complete